MHMYMGDVSLYTKIPFELFSFNYYKYSTMLYLTYFSQFNFVVTHDFISLHKYAIT